MIIGSRIEERLKVVGISQAELARRVKLQQSTINGLIRGGQQSSTRLPQIARELGTTAAYLTGETDDPHAETPDLMLSSDERELIDNMRVLAPNDRASFMGLARSLAAAATPPTLHDNQQTYRGEG